ncbi:MAG: hypothetical protein A3F82_06685 [Deltaproteobacteria bacterium RIFCSPLOWO2_12_FULL_44_12]|nr:MAG: hypothetical protein A2712_09520 [Deltaproteobacteria bacterium RIFCSPHIGHO2_01_FULL_43_49]OGQ14943.1 MAG: hypothetical protein A3D22_00165 [Deltaproteobacteria bacterium RIFCSPHIGHO2_02_FULL_44_53]OGQ29554.1 MAG: hypothetical protein A3D98_10250 [Deltaproteobacteria bacterium RIFCSPHIGHO2_12_FULL_44_21]OGQ31055.1 MAG: hypothetical protein A2979_06455 [Deltaproteobacteria bacterium RIFCSPLOWO2_01_FULL_45_74]OGQ42657.1 MAG: hypothetical protein A3I70_02125 [Deltaproteobacteria bacterium 
MAQEKEKQASSVEFPVNQKLLDEALKLKEERHIIKERLSKIEQGRSEVSPSVYGKVHNDYTVKLQTLTDQLLAKKQDIDRELATLYETRDKIQANLKDHKEILEELQFRQKLGEFSKEEFQNQSKATDDKIRRFEQVLKGVQTNVQRYEGLFKGDEDLFGSLEEIEKPLRIEEEVDEWEEEAKEAGDKQEWLEATKPQLETKPAVTIIAGQENVGKTFYITNTLSIGRSHNNQIVLKDAKVSRQHAEIRIQGEEYLVVDLNSSNGTMVNGQKVHEHILSPNDEIQIGDFVMQFQR